MTTILVVDDDPVILEWLTEMIEENGDHALYAFNGIQGLDIARESHPDIILADVQMPLLDGYSLLREVRAEPELAQTPVVLMSTAFERAVGTPSGTPNGYLHKPFTVANMDHLFAKVLN